LIELHTKVPDLLKVNDYVRFVHTESKFSPTFKSNVFYKVTKTVQVPYTISFIIPEGDVTIMKLSDYGLYPQRPHSLYQILIGFGGSDGINVYAKIPETDFILRLEEAQFEPNPLIEQLSFLGCYSKEDSSIDKPKLIVYTVKDFEEIAFVIFNAGSDYGKLIIHTVVNICQLEETEEKPTVWKDILHYKLLR